MNFHSLKRLVRRRPLTPEELQAKQEAMAHLKDAKLSQFSGVGQNDYSRRGGR